MKKFVKFEMTVMRPIELHIEGHFHPELKGNMVDPPEGPDLDVARCEDEYGHKTELSDEEQQEAIHAAQDMIAEMAATRGDED